MAEDKELLGSLMIDPSGGIIPVAMMGQINQQTEAEANKKAQEPVEDPEPVSADGKDMANNATMAGISAAGRKHEQEQQNALNQQIAAAQMMGLLGPIQQPMSGMQRQLAQQRMGLSEAYNQFDQAAQLAMADGKGDTAKELLSLRDAAAQQAQLFDQQMQMAGVSLPSVYGAGVPLAVQQQAYATDSMAGLDRLLNKDMSSDEYYDQQYRKFRNAGYSDRRATKMAAEAAQNYYYDRIKRLNDGFNTYGLDGGNMNANGVDILQRLAQEDSEQANVLNNMYTSPQKAQEQAIKQALEKAKLEAAMQRAYMTQQGANQRAMLKEQGANGRTSANINAKFAIADATNQLKLRDQEIKIAKYNQAEMKKQDDFSKTQFNQAAKIREQIMKENIGLSGEELMKIPEYKQATDIMGEIAFGNRYSHLSEYSGPGSFTYLLDDMLSGEGAYEGHRMTKKEAYNIMAYKSQQGLIPPEFIENAVAAGDLERP